MADPRVCPLPRAILLQVVRDVAQEAKLHPREVLASGGRKTVVEARWEAWRRLRATYGYAPIARAWGCHHTTVIHAMRQLDAGVIPYART